jgi:hypothetical protein
MMHWDKFVSYYMWIAPHILLIPVLVILYARSLHKKFPVFFLYACYEIVQFVLLFGIYRFAADQATLYQYLYIGTLAGSVVLRFGVVQEVFNHYFQDFPRLESLATACIRVVTVMLLAAAIWSAIYASGPASDQLMAGISLLDRSVGVIQAGLLLFLFAFSSLFGLAGGDFAFAIALGFGLVAVTDLAVSALRLTFTDVPFVKVSNFIVTGSYHVSVVIWLGYLLAANKIAVAVPTPVPELDHWSGELERSI